MKPAEAGLRIGRLSGYALAIAQPLVVIGLLTMIALTFSGAPTPRVSWSDFVRKTLINAAAGSLVVLLTEEGFFRGWLWASLRRAGKSPLMISSVAFMIWHISAVALNTGFNPPLAQVPVLLANVLVLGLTWGTMREVSDSIVAPAFAHSLWNALAYRLFGFGSKVGALGVAQTAIFAPEVGVLGLVVNLAFLAVCRVISSRHN
jgi:membrane protease YdiL (CAAX protease family)